MWKRIAASLVLSVGAGAAWGGTVVAAPGVRAFGNVSVSGGAAASTVVLTNSGSNTEVTGLVLGPGCAEFTASATLPVTLVAGGTLVLSVAYDPIDRIADVCVVTLAFGAPSGTGGAFQLTGDGAAPVLAVAPPSVAFTNQRWNGGTPEPVALTLSNLGEEPIATANLAVTLTTGTHFSLGARAGFPIAPGGSGSQIVVFDPASAGTVSDTVTLSLNNDAPAEPNPTVGLSGLGTQSTQTFTPSSALFVGTAPAGSPVQADLFIGNAGTAPLTLQGPPAMAFSGPNAADFSFLDHGCAGQTCNPAPNVVGVGTSSTFAVRCTPSAGGTRTATLTVRSDDPASPRTLPVSCVGTVPALSTSPATLAFGLMQVGQPSSPRDILILNGTGAAPLSYSVVSSNPSEFLLQCAGGGTACLAGTIPGGSSATVQVIFNPLVTGARAGVFTITSNDPDDGTRVIALSGTGGLPNLTVVSPLGFGNVAVTQPGGATANLTLSNSGSVPLDLTQLQITGAADFSFAFGSCTSGQSCAAALSIAALSSTVITLRCDPATVGLKTASLAINSDDPSSPELVSLTCTGVAPEVTVSPLSLTFGAQRVGTGSPTQSFAVSNAGLAPLSYGVTLSSPHFSIACAPACAGSLAPATAATVTVTFTPAALGAQSATLTVTTDDGDEPTTAVGLSGTGVCVADTDCASTERCLTGQCVPRAADGTACVAGGECLSAFCVDGRCCNTGCTEQCGTCAAPGNLGTCTFVTGAPIGSRPACTSDGSACAGRCDGTSSTCVYPAASTSCRAASCAAGVATASASCDGAGACPALQTQACAPYSCGPTGCRGNCTTDLECASSSFCAAGVCASKLARGVSCSAAGQCSSGFCIDGVCCDGACGGQCEACDVAGLVGTCSTVQSGAPRGGRPACSGMGACVGQCDGTSAALCTAGVATSELCNGADDDCDGVVDDGVCSDAGSADAGPSDAGSDDAGPTDAGSDDAGATDAGSDDAGATDAGAVSDAGAAADAGTTPDGGTTMGPPGGCGCSSASPELVFALLLSLTRLVRRRVARSGP